MGKILTQRRSIRQKPREREIQEDLNSESKNELKGEFEDTELSKEENEESKENPKLKAKNDAQVPVIKQNLTDLSENISLEQEKSSETSPTQGKKRRFGPRKTTEHINVTTRIDYQPYLCKDYNETGYCGFGESCIYVHDRGDYKASWELDLEWEQQQQKAKKQPIQEQVSLEPKPFTCPICCKELASGASIVKSGRCGHEFCESCAISRFAQDKKCAVCSVVLDGRFQFSKIN
jgi:RING finger protein 113A